MSVLLQFRRDTAANWTSLNPVLSSGEIGYETDTGSMKIGNGASAWTALTYFTPATVSGATFVSPNGLGFTNVTTYTSGTSWTVPTVMREVGAKWKVTIIGGGGGSGACSANPGDVGGGGGSGGVVVGYFAYVSGQNTMTYSIGAAGTAGVNAGANGGAGGNTTVTYNGVTWTAAGGGGGVNATTGSGGAGGAGGAATGGSFGLVGGRGENGGTMAATSNYQGNGGSTPLGFGFGGVMPASTSAVGLTGSLYGAGASGGKSGTGSARNGAVGIQGILIVEY